MIKKQVLIIEDDPIISWNLSIELRKVDYEVVDVLDSVADIESIDFKKVPQDCLIIINLKLYHGWVPFEMLRSILSSSFQIVLLTGLADLELYNKELLAMDFTLLLKPYTFVQLVKVLQ